MDFSRFGRLGRSISHSFYSTALFETGLVAIQPTKKFCEIAAVAVSPSYCAELARAFFRPVVAARNREGVFRLTHQVGEVVCRILR
jgi:hypothetical protein